MGGAAAPALTCCQRRGKDLLRLRPGNRREALAPADLFTPPRSPCTVRRRVDQQMSSPPRIDLLFDGQVVTWTAHGSFKATSGLTGHQLPEEECIPDAGPTPQGLYVVPLTAGWAQSAKLDLSVACGLLPGRGWERIPGAGVVNRISPTGGTTASGSMPPTSRLSVAARRRGTASISTLQRRGSATAASRSRTSFSERSLRWRGRGGFIGSR
jgi:hypothetical protein